MCIVGWRFAADAIQRGSGRRAHFRVCDGNGNVRALVKASDSAVSANYKFGPFGEPIRVTGPMAKENPFRFSTKRTDNTTDFVLYEYRAYSPTLGRWLSRDPIGERGGRNLYRFVDNDPLSRVDTLGHETWYGKCDLYGVNWIIGVQFVDCYLTSPCRECKYYWVHVKAWLFVGSPPVGIPVNVTGFRAIFETPGANPMEFTGSAALLSVSIVIWPKIVSFGHLHLGAGKMVNSFEVKGLDVGLTGGFGYSWVRQHRQIPCTP